MPQLTGFTATFTVAENSANETPQLIDADVTFTDAEGDFDRGTVTVSGLLAEDRIGIRNEGNQAGQIGVSGNSVTYGTDVIGTFSTVGGVFTVTLNAAATTAAVDALIQNLTYQNVSDTPTASRTLNLNVTEASGADLAGGQDFTVNVTAQNDAPTATITPLLAPAGGEERVNETAANTQDDPAAAALAGGGHVVVWSSAGQDGSSRGVYAQRYDASGTPQGEVRVNTTTSEDQYDAAVAGLTGGGYVVTWTSFRQDVFNTNGVYMQRFNADGVAQGGETRVNTTTSGNQQESSVAGLAEGGYVVTWTAADADGEGVFMQRYNSEGQPQGLETRVNTYTTNRQDQAEVTGLTGPDGGFVVTWFSLGQDGGRSGIYMQRYDKFGAPVGDELKVNSTSGSPTSPTVGALGDGGYVVSWSDTGAFGNYQIYAQRYDADGNRVDGQVTVNTNVFGHKNNPSVTAMADGGWVIAWQDPSQQDGDNTGVYGQRYSASGPGSVASS